LHAAVKSGLFAPQKVAVTDHPIHRQSVGHLAQNRAALALETSLRRIQYIVAHPNLKQVAQDKQGVGLQVLHGNTPSFESGFLAGLQMHIGNKA
jgi:hypothetical protein